MKTYKIIIIMVMIFLPILMNAQENSKNWKNSDVITQITDRGATFTISGMTLDSSDISAIKHEIIRQIQIITEKRLNQNLENISNRKSLDSNIKEEQLDKVFNLTKQIKANDIIYDDTYLYALNINDTYDDDYGMYYYSEWKITQYLLSTGKVVAGTDYKEGNGRFKTFKELEAQKDFRPVKECKLAQKVFQLMKQQRVDNIVKRIKASDIIYDDTYLYALNINNTYDDDYGMYYYSEWKITQYLLSTGKVIAGTGYIEGDGRFKTFKELEAQKDFRPVKECELAQEVFRIMKQQGK